MARGNVSNTAASLARLCYDLLLQDGREALDAVKAKKVTPALEKAVEASIYLSGLGFESGGLAAAHAINDGFNHAPQCHDRLHGEKVAFGTLVQLVLERSPEDELKEVLTFMKSVDLPMTLAQLGMETLDYDTLGKVAEAACVPTETIKNLSPDIKAEDVLSAILEADKIGRTYLAQN
jgi:glycerol dehydrogenase